MLQYAAKVAITAMLVIAVTEIAKRNTLMGALLASLPMTSLLAFVWLYWDTGDATLAADLAVDILWLVLASLVFFVAFPVLVRSGVAFWPSLGVSGAITAACYLGMASLLGWLRAGS